MPDPSFSDTGRPNAHCPAYDTSSPTYSPHAVPAEAGQFQVPSCGQFIAPAAVAPVGISAVVATKMVAAKQKITDLGNIGSSPLGTDDCYAPGWGRFAISGKRASALR